MDIEPKDLTKKINILIARQSVLQHLILAMFDSIPDQTLVIDEFSATTNLSNVLDMAEAKSDDFRNAFQRHRDGILEILQHAKDRAKA